ncbi:MAG TPA: glycosyltransferase family 2 protein, partial [Bacteroidales bacterium]
MVTEEKPDITVIILTFNEELHICRCVTNAFLFAKQVFIIDSYSTDKTVEIAESLGAIVLKNKWENNHAKQVNWALENCPFTTDWILRLDADEFLTEKLIKEIKAKIPILPADISGVVLPRQIYFLGQRIKRGTGVVKILRLFKNKKARCEDRLM